MYYGRDEILQELESKYLDDNKHLIVLYGKRRHGKTSILKKFVQEKESNFYICTEAISKDQLKTFSTEILKNHPLKTYISTFENWEKAFEFLLEDSIKEKKLLIIDELPYLGNSEKSILSIIQKLWDKYEESKLMCILTGSSLSYMEKNILNEESPLYGRLSLEAKIEPLEVLPSLEFLKNKHILNPLDHYLIFGGVPRYIKLLEEGKTLAENITSNLLNKYSILFQELTFLMKEDLREPTTYFSLLRSLSLGNNTIKDLQNDLNIEKTKVNVYLKNLIELNYVNRITPLFLKGEKANSHLSKYEIKENILNFYFKFINGNQSSLEILDGPDFFKTFIKDGLNSHLDLMKENLVYELFKELNKENYFPVQYLEIEKKWNTSKVNIPLIALNQKENAIATAIFYNNDLTLIENVEEIKKKYNNLIQDNTMSKMYYIFLEEKNSQIDISELRNYEQIDQTLRFITIEEIMERR